MWGKEVVLVTLTCIQVAHHHEEAGVLDVYVGVGIDDRVVAHLDVLVAIALYGVLSYIRRIVGCLVACEVSGICTQLDVEHLHHLELDEQVGVYIEVWHRQGALAAGMLVGNHVLPVEDAKLEVLLQLCCEQVDGIAALHRSHRYTRSQSVFCDVILLREVGVVLDFIHSHSQGGIGLSESQGTHDAGMDNLAQVVVPPEMAGVILAIVERWIFVVDEGITPHLYGISQEWQVDIHIAVYCEGSGIYSGQSHFAYYIIVKGLSLGLAQLSAHAQRMLVVFVESAFHVWQFIMSEVIAGESLQASLSPFAESFERSHRNGVLDAPVLGLVVDGIASKFAGIVILLEIVILWSLVCLVNTSVIVKLNSMDEAGYRHIFRLVEERVL